MSSGPARKALVLRDIKAKSKKLLQGSGASLVLGPPPTATQVRLQNLQKKVVKFLDSKPVTIFMTISTVFALFGDDIRLASAPAAADNSFSNVSFAVLILYTVELLLNVLAKPNYLWSFYFWLDLVSTASLIVDVGW